MDRQKLINLIPALEAWYDTIPAMCETHMKANRTKDAEDFANGESDFYLVNLESNVTYAFLHTPLAKELDPEQNILNLWYFIEKYLPKTDEVKARIAEIERLEKAMAERMETTKSETVMAGAHEDYEKWADLANGLFVDALKVFLDGLKKNA